MNAWRPQASYPCGNFSDTSNFEIRNSPVDRSPPAFTKGSLGPAFTSNTCTERISQITNWPDPLLQVSDLDVVIIVHLRYRLTSVPPQPNSRSDPVPDG
jgi:hypothetical protein